MTVCNSYSLPRRPKGCIFFSSPLLFRAGWFLSRVIWDLWSSAVLLFIIWDRTLLLLHWFCMSENWNIRFYSVLAAGLSAGNVSLHQAFDFKLEPHLSQLFVCQKYWYFHLMSVSLKYQWIRNGVHMSNGKGCGKHNEFYCHSFGINTKHLQSCR